MVTPPRRRRWCPTAQWTSHFGSQTAACPTAPTPGSQPPLRALSRSFISGAKNNLLGMVGFVREGRKSKNAFNERMEREKELLALAEAKRKARLDKGGQ